MKVEQTTRDILIDQIRKVYEEIDGLDSRILGLWESELYNGEYDRAWVKVLEECLSVINLPAEDLPEIEDNDTNNLLEVKLKEAKRKRNEIYGDVVKRIVNYK